MSMAPSTNASAKLSGEGSRMRRTNVRGAWTTTVKRDGPAPRVTSVPSHSRNEKPPARGPTISRRIAAARPEVEVDTRVHCRGAGRVAHSPALHACYAFHRRTTPQSRGTDGAIAQALRR